MEPYLCGDSLIHKATVIGRLCSVHDTCRDNRALIPIVQKTRAVAASEIHEIILFAESMPDGSVNKAGYLGFVEILGGGILKTGDRVFVNGCAVGTLYGFDQTHMPNHFNILIHCDHLVTGVNLECQFGDAVCFVGAERFAII